MRFSNFVAWDGRCLDWFFSKFYTYNNLQFTVLIRLIAIGALTQFAGVSSADNAADDGREHVFPLVVDGGGFRTHLFLNNISDPGNRCALELRGPGLDATAFEDTAALITVDATAEIDLGETGSAVMLKTSGEEALAFGYAQISCEKSAIARMLLAWENDGAPVAMTNIDRAQVGTAFQFPLLPRLGRLGLALSNDDAMDAACAVELETAAGMSVGGGDIDVPAQSTAFQFLDELVPMGDDLTDGTVSVSCSRAVAVAGLPLSGGVFTALKAIVQEDSDESQSYRVLPLVMDGEGIQSHLVATNLSEAANRCTMHFHGAGVSTARFPSTGDVTKDGFRRAMFELAADGGQVSMLSLGRHTFAYGYATLDCEAPVAVRNLLTVGAGDSVAGMAAVLPIPLAVEVEFPVVPGLDRMAFFLTNASESDAVCEANLTAAGREDSISAEASILVRGESTEVRFLADLFEVSDDFSGGSATLSCDNNIAAIALPFAGSAFAAMPPAVLRFDTTPVFGEETVIPNQSYTEGSDIDALQLPEASGGEGALVYSLMPDLRGIVFNPATRSLTGAPIRPGEYDMTYTATDEDGDTVSLGFTVTIEPRPEPLTPSDGDSGGSNFGDGAPPPSQPQQPQPPPQPPLDPNVCRVGLVLNSANTGCIHRNPFFSFTISDPHGIGVWRGVFSGARQAGLTAGPTRLEVSDFVAVRASDSETWTILQCACE